MNNDPQWSVGTREGMAAAAGCADAIAEAFVSDGDDDEALIAREVGGLLLGRTAALCSAIADLAAALRGRPAR